MSNLIEAVIGRLYKYMDERKLTLYRLSIISGVPFATVKSLFQRQTKGIELKTVLMFVQGLKVTPSEFFDDPAFSAENLLLE